jgi:transcriptional regulator GlxA family with amidase domain
MHRVVVVAIEPVMPFELAIPARVFGSAFDDDGRPLYEVVTCSLDGAPVRTNSDFAIVVDHGPEVIVAADTVVLPPIGDIKPVPQAPDPPPALIEALDRMRPGCRLVSLCGAAFLLAATGRLEGRTATTHWILADQFRRRHPDVPLDPEVLFVDCGDVLTAAGAAAGADLCLHLVRRDHGSEVANRVARFCVMAPYRDGGQRQFIRRPTPDPLAATTEPSRQWALEHLGERITLTRLAARSRLSVRSFTRRFREEVGQSPGEWLLQQRLERARSLLESTEAPVELIAGSCGLGTAGSLRQHFRRHVGVPPSAYRRSFRARA